MAAMLDEADSELTRLNSCKTAIEREIQGMTVQLSVFAQERNAMAQERSAHEVWQRESSETQTGLQAQLGELAAKVSTQRFAVATIMEDHEALLRKVDTAAACADEHEARTAAALAQHQQLQLEVHSMTEGLARIEMSIARALEEKAESERACAEAEIGSNEARQRHADALQGCAEAEAELAALSNQVKRSRAALKRNDAEQQQSLETFELELVELQLKQAEQQGLVERTDAIIAQRAEVEASWQQQRLAWKKDAEKQHAQKIQWEVNAQKHARQQAEHEKDVAGWKREADEMRKYRAVLIQWDRIGYFIYYRASLAHLLPPFHEPQTMRLRANVPTVHAPA